MPYAPCSAHALIWAHVVAFLSRCPDRVFTPFFVLVHRQATLPSSEILAAEGRAPCKVYQVAYLQNQPSEDARRAIARAQRAPRGRRVRLDLQRALPDRLRRARDTLHAALASFQTRGGDSDGTKARRTLVREGVAEALEGVRALGRQGFFVEPTSAVVWKGLTKLHAEEPFAHGSTIVTILSGHGLKASEKLAELTA